MTERDAAPRRVLFLHGFASSADSSKGRFFAERFAACPAVLFDRLDLNQPDFSTLTVTRMIGQVEAAIGQDARDAAIIGSSLGGLVAWLVAARAEQRGSPLDRLVLLAPAFDFAPHGFDGLGPALIEAWRVSGWREFPHFAFGDVRQLDYAIQEDAAQYDAERVVVTCPTLVFQGRHDEVVSAASAQRMAANRPNIRLVLLDDDHQLHASLPGIWRDSARFLSLTDGD